jgi:hypothetical protein
VPDVNGHGHGNGGAGNGNGSPPAAEGLPEAIQPIGADLRAALRTKAERIPLRALERRGFRNVQVLDMATIEKIVAEAVTHCLERHTAMLSGEDRAKVELEARREFAKLLAEHKKLVAEKSEETKRAEELERQIQGLVEELDRRKGDLRDEIGRNIDAATFRLSPESFKEMEDKIRALFGRLVSDERRVSLAEAGPGALRGLSQLELEVASFLDRMLVGERDRFIGSVKKTQTEKVDVLEKRIAKLNKALAESEGALRQLAELKSDDPGIASIYEKIQGLNLGDRYYSRKKELLEQIFLENLQIQKKDPSVVAAQAATAVAAPPKRSLDPASDALRKLGFEPPVEVAGEAAF